MLAQLAAPTLVGAGRVARSAGSLSSSMCLCSARPPAIQSRRGVRGFRSTSACLSGGRSGRGTPFVSQHYDGIPSGAVVDFLERLGINEWKRVGQGWLNLQVCPDAVCAGTNSQKSSKRDAGNHFTFGVNEKSGGFQCFRCNSTGNWSLLLIMPFSLSLPSLSSLSLAPSTPFLTHTRFALAVYVYSSATTSPYTPPFRSLLASQVHLQTKNERQCRK